MKTGARTGFFAWAIVVLSSLPLPAEDEGEIRDLLAGAGGEERHGDAAQVIVFDRTLNRCEENGRSTVIHEVLAKILKEEGARNRSVLTLGYDPKTNRAEFLRVRVFKSGGKTQDVPVESLDIPSPGGIIFWGGRRKLLAVPGLEPGDGIEIVTKTVGFKIAYLGDDGDDRYVPPMRGHFYDIVRFWTGVPVLEKRYVLIAPRSKPVHFAVYNGPLAVTLTHGGEDTIYTFEARDMKPFEGEDGMVSHWDVAPKLVLTTVPDWPTKSRWFWEVNEPQFQVEKSIRKKVGEILVGLESDGEKIKALVHWVADEVRYLGLSMGKGEGYTTHPATMTFRERSGVCKDKAGLLVAMLRVAGFESFIAMTQVGSRVEAVAADQFNHAVTALRLADGRFLMLDPTWAPASREMWSSLEQEQYFVIGTRRGEPLDRAPYFPPENNRLTVLSTVSVHVLPGGAELRGECILEAQGYPDTFFRRKLQKTPKGREKLFFETLLEAVAPGTEIRELEFTGIRDYSRPMRILLRWRSSNAVLASAEGIFLRAPVLGMMRRFPLVDRFRKAAEPEKRTHPFNVKNTIEIRFRETIEAPEGFAWACPWNDEEVGALETEAIASAGEVRYARFTLSRKPLGRSMIVEGALSIPHKQVPSPVYPDFQRVMFELDLAMNQWFEMGVKE